LGKAKKIIFAAGVLVVACIGPIITAHALAEEKSKNPCAEDIAKFCKDAKSDSQSPLKCLKEHENELSEACKAYELKKASKRLETREEIRARTRFRRACRDDIAKLCKGVNPADGGLIKCLQEHEKELSGLCSENLKAVVTEKKKKE
jgi:hypothetical protein